MFERELVEFLESGCSTIVGLVTVDGHPYATRGWGTEVLPGDEPRIRVLLGAGTMAALGRAAGDGARFAIAVTGADVRTLRSVQLKGTAGGLEPANEADLARSRRFCDEFFADVAAVDGISPEQMARLVPSDLLAATIEVAELYDQTPGPGAGAPLTAARR